MSMRPLATAESIRKQLMRRASCDAAGTVLAVDAGVYAFRVYDNDGGILTITVAQFKEPLR